MKSSPAKLGGIVLLVMTACRASPGSLTERDLVSGARPITLESRGALDPRFVPALEALEGVLADGNDVVARHILDRLLVLGPTGPALDLTHSFERILAGREAVAEVALALENSLVPGAKGEANRLRISFAARRARAGECTLEPGPATLRIVVTSIDVRGNTSHNSQMRSFDDLRTIVIRAGKDTVLPLVELPVGLPKGALALMVKSELTLCSGSVREGDVTLPAMRLRILPGEATILASTLEGLGTSTPEEFSSLGATPTTSVRSALECAVRLPLDQREAALDLLAENSDRLVLPTLERMAPALAWLDPTTHLGNDAVAWRGFLRARQRSSEAEARRGGLNLPRYTPSSFAEREPR